VAHIVVLGGGVCGLAAGLLLRRDGHEVTERWTALIRACPRHAHWLDGEPLTGVMAMGGIVDRHRRLEGVTGLALAGDAWACTNPSQGRGMAMALQHVSRLRDAVRDHLGDPRGFAAAWDAITAAELEPFYRETVEQDRDRLREMEALRDGRHYVRPPGSTGALLEALGRAAGPIPTCSGPSSPRDPASRSSGTSAPASGCTRASSTSRWRATSRCSARTAGSCSSC